MDERGLFLVRAPVSTLAAVRTTTDVMGSPPINPQTILPMPCARNSLFGDDIRLYGSSRSAASRESSVSRLPTAAIVPAAAHTVLSASAEKSGNVNRRKKSARLAGTGKLTRC